MLNRSEKVEVADNSTPSLPIKFGKWVATFVAVATPVFYLNGRAFHDGYLEHLHLVPSMFPADVQDTFICAARAWLEESNALLGTVAKAIRAHWGVVLLLPITLVTVLSATAHYVIYRAANSKLQAKKRFGIPKILRSILTPVLAVLFSAYTIYTFVAVIGALLILSIAPFAQVGADIAAQDIARGFPESPVVEVTPPHSQTATYRIIECSDKFCGLYKSGQISITPISSIIWATADIDDPHNFKAATNANAQAKQ
jgi:hypothetical protein